MASCTLGEIGSFKDVSSVRTILFGDPKEESQPQVDQNEWNDSNWGDWDDEQVLEDNNDEDGSERDTTPDTTWLHRCHLSMSPCNDVIALARQDNLVILAQSADLEVGTDSEPQYAVKWRGNISQSERESITCILCLPLASQKRSSQGGPDWTCIIVGFSTGFVRMYTENATLLLSQFLHNGPVVQLKCRSYAPQRYQGLPEQTEELSVLYGDALVTIDGFSLFQTLRACRNHAARAAANGADNTILPPLAYKKWGIQDQYKTKDYVSCGSMTPNLFDQMQTASMLGGYKASIKASPPASSVFLTAGDGPYVCVYHAIEGTTAPLLADVAYAMAHKLTSKLFSAASGWLKFGQKRNPSSKVENSERKVEPAHPLAMRYSLPDKPRVGETIVLSPSGHLAAVTDSYGRVAILDVMKGQAVRIWKGYRDAQVGWVEVDESNSRHDHHVPTKKAMFLVIYASRRGILEVWLSEQGPRVAAFSVEKYCKLVCFSYTMIGLNNTNYRGVKDQTVQCCLVDYRGVIRAIHVPFHMALSDTSNKRVHDLHLIKKIKSILRGTKDDSERTCMEDEMRTLVHRMKTVGVRQQAIERLLSSKMMAVPFLVQTIDMAETDSKDQGDVEGRMFLSYCSSQKHLISTYRDFLQHQLKCEAMDISQHSLQEILGLSESELTHISQRVDSYRQTLSANNTNHVTFEMTNEMDVSEYLECFHGDPTKHGSNAKLRNNLSQEQSLRLAQFIFGKHLEGPFSFENIIQTLEEAQISAEQAMKLFMDLWFSEERNSLEGMPQLFAVVKAVTDTNDISDIVVHHNCVSTWWQIIRDKCCHVTNVGAAYILEIVCRSITIQATAAYNMLAGDNEESMDLSDWEAISLDVEKFNLVIKQTEDILAMNSVLCSRVNGANARGSPPPPREGLLSVSRVLEAGTGVLSEYLARWICQHNVPLDIFLTSPNDDSTQGSDSDGKNEHHSSTDEHIRRLHVRFPYSLDSSTLLANIAWEYTVNWNKDPGATDQFSKAVTFLNLVQNGIFQHGVSMMMWQMFLLKKISAAAALMQKVGKPPKERLCRKEIDMSDKSLTSFLETSCRFFRVLMQANCDAHDMPLLQSEDLWADAKGATSLAGLALNQKMSNYVLLKHHWTLLTIMHAVMAFNMKAVKIYSLFDTKGQQAFFKDLNCHPYFDNQELDVKIINARQQFVVRVLDAALSVAFITEVDSSLNMSPEQAQHWPQTLLELSTFLEMDVDLLRQHHACQLFSYGRDKLGHQALQAVMDHTELGSKLLDIAGQRLAQFVYKRDVSGSAEHMSKLTPTVSMWLQERNVDELHASDVDLKDTAVLLGHVMNMLPEGQSHYKIAVSLIDIVQTLT